MTNQNASPPDSSDEDEDVSLRNAKRRQPSGSLAAQQEAAEGSDVENAPPPHGQKKSRRTKRRIFGLSHEHPAYILPDDYEKRYPQDEFGQEMGPNARVWRVYLDEAELNDRDMVEGWKDGIDVLLVFAGLFSAVVTTFVTQTSQKLDQDFGQVSASLLTELVALQRSLAAGSSFNSVSPSKLNLTSLPQFSSSDAWVNGLWFASLTLSLVTALYAVLIKQWVQYYVSFITGTPQERARIHHFRYVGIQRWSVPAIIGVLPMLLYVAVFSFLLGLVVFLRALKPEIAYVVAVIGGAAFVLHVTTNVLPVLYARCPYRTPLIENVYAMICYAAFIVRRVIFLLTNRFIPQLLLRSRAIGLHRQFHYLESWCMSAALKGTPSYKAKALKLFESKAAEEIQDQVVSEVISWLLTSSSNPSVKPIALQSISGLRLGFSQINGLFDKGSLVRKELLNELHSHSDLSSEDVESFIGSPLFYGTERILRAFMFIPDRYWGALHGARIPITTRHLQAYIDPDKRNVALQQALTTYIIHHVNTCLWNRAFGRKDDLGAVSSEVMPALLSLLGTTNEYAMVWRARFNSLQSRAEAFEYSDPSLAGVYNWLQPLFGALLDRNCSPETWGAVAPFVCRALPSHAVEGHSDLLSRFPVPIDRVMLWSSQNKLRVMLLRGVNEECRSRPNGIAELEKVVVAAINSEEWSVHSFKIGWRVEFTAKSPFAAAALDELCSQPLFSNDFWSSQTYLNIFSVYLGFLDLFERHPTSFLPWTPSPLKHLPNILSNKECTYGLVRSIFHLSNEYDGVIKGLIKQIMCYLAGLKAPNPLIGDVMDSLCMAFLDGMLGSVTPAEGLVKIYEHWPVRMQPLVRWILAQMMARDGTEHPHPIIQTFTTKLAERADVLTFISSSFLIVPDGYGYKLAFSEESYILLELATYHKDKPDATDTWRAFLSWIVAKSSGFHSPRHEWPHGEESSERYARMAKFVDQLVSTLGLDDSELKLPRLVNDGSQSTINQTPGVHTAYPAEEAAKGRSIFQRLIPWKTHSSAGANQEEIGLESNQRAIVEDL